ncbi:MAG: hypothetical protein RL391_1291 [Actinomycetota bacterium]
MLSGNVTCAELNADEINFPSVTRDFGVKVEPVADGTYYFTSSDAILQGGQPEDPYNFVTLSDVSGGYFDWSASLDIQAVIVKGGPDSNAFVYFPEQMSDTDLHAPVNPETGQPYGLSHVTFCHNYDLNAVLNPHVGYARYYYWTLDKEVTPASRTGFAGQDLSYDYTVTAAWDYYEDADWIVDGTLEIANPSPLTVDFTVAGTFDGAGNDLTVDCPSYTLAPDSEVTCDISFMPGSDPDGETITVDVTSLTDEVSSTSTTATLVTGLPSDSVNDTVSVQDTWPWSETAEHDELGTVFEFAQFDYSRTYTCPTDLSLYTNGMYSTEIVNRADIHETGQYDEATVEAICYVPTAEKTAIGTRGQSWEWSVDKSVDPDSQTGVPGESLDWDWAVNVDSTLVGESFSVIGTITVTNPNSESSVEVSVTDQLDDGTVAAVDCDSETEGDQSTVTLAGDATIVCTYSAEPEDDSATLNTATIGFGEGIEVTATADVEFTTETTGGSADLTDEQIGLDETLTAGDGPWEFTGAGSGHTCSSDAEDYGSDGVYNGSDSNTATLTVVEGPTLTSSDSTDYECRAGLVNVRKTVDGEVDPSTEFTFSLYAGPDGFGGTVLGSSSSGGDSDGVLDLGAIALDPTATFTVCENEMPVGYTSVWMIDDEPVVAYNPDAPSEDYGNRCVDIGEGTDFEFPSEATMLIEVDNQTPTGGAPRSPGYWKNWTELGKGHQALTAAANGGWENGFWLLDDVLDQSIGGGVRWDDIMSDSFPSFWLVPEQAVEILQMRVVTIDGKVGNGKVMASDPLRQLARNLLAAQLNLGAGACFTSAVITAVENAEALLDKYDFDGKATTAYPIGKKGSDASLARTLSGYLDGYNNGLVCSGSE